MNTVNGKIGWGWPPSARDIGDWGALDGGPQCRLSNLRNGNVPCRYLCISHVDFKVA